MKIKSILTEHPNTIVSLKAEDLGLFARQVVSEVRQEFEREQEMKTKETVDKIDLLTAEEVKAILDISDSTLYRLGKSELLVPIWVGGQRRYAKADIDHFLERR